MLDKHTIDFAIDSVVGTSAVSAGHYAVQGNLVAYIASGGVVVNKIDADGHVRSQNFFSANAPNVPIATANAYLSMAMPEAELKDSFGYAIGEPTVVNGNNQATDDEVSPSKHKDRVRSISCISLSPNGRLLAIGEFGYQPRILLFSLAPNAKNCPIALIYDHSFGLANLEFSPDARYLCSLGVVNDGVFNVWKVTNQVHLVASNRCSSVINQVLWHEEWIITLGLRLIKVWQFEEVSEPDKKIARPALLKGKNVILGPYINNSFLSGSVLNADEVLVGTNNNQLLLLKLGADLKLTTLEPPNFDFKTFTVDFDLEKIWFMSDDFQINSTSINELKVTEQTTMSAPSSPTRFEQSIVVRRLNHFFTNKLLYLDETGSIVVYNKLDGTKKTLLGALSKELASVKNYSSRLIIATKNGKVLEVKPNGGLDSILNYTLPSAGFISNALMSVEICDKLIALGDKLGYLYIHSLKDDGASECIYTAKAHESSISDIVMFSVDKRRFLCSISRDRMIQIFHETAGGWDILQTLPVHTGNLLKVQIANNLLVVCSSDKTVSVHKIIMVEDQPCVTNEKILSLKNTPVTMKIHDDELIISTNDKNLSIYDFKTFDLLRTLKLFNDKTNESLLVENFLIHNNQIIVACFDKSLRSFNYHSGKPLTTNWGHASTILDISVHNNTMTSVSVDGCLFRWRLTSEKVEDLMPSPIEQAPDNIFPQYTKVTRRIIPTSPSKREETGNSTTTAGLSTPRLTTSTIRRMEASRKVEARTRPVSPVRPARPTSPIKRPSSPVKRPAVDFSRNPSKALASPSPIRQSNSEFMDKATANLNEIKTYVANNDLSEAYKRSLASKLRETLQVLDVEDMETNLASLSIKDNALLETYSEKLVQLVAAKLNK